MLFQLLPIIQFQFDFYKQRDHISIFAFFCSQLYFIAFNIEI